SLRLRLSASLTACLIRPHTFARRAVIVIAAGNQHAPVLERRRRGEVTRRVELAGDGAKLARLRIINLSMLSAAGNQDAAVFERGDGADDLVARLIHAARAFKCAARRIVD